MKQAKVILAIATVVMLAIMIVACSQSSDDTYIDDTQSNGIDVAQENHDSDDQLIGGTPGSCGYQWDEARGGWHRPWDADSFIHATDKPEWEAFIPETVNVSVSCEDFWADESPVIITKDLIINIGDFIQVALCSNPTTGFEWGEAQISASSILDLAERKYEPGDGAKQDPPIPGSGGTEVLTLRALDIGKSTITIEYSQPWEGGQKANWTFVLTVTVE